jgi:TetR/AcrR family transcriptional regulator, regulator of autoinduction and epiphytic fitness
VHATRRFVPGATIRDRRRQVIIEAAADALITHGRDGFRVEYVAERAMMSRRTVFNYFPAVAELVAEAVAERYGDIVANVRSLPLSVGDLASGEAALDDLIATMRCTDVLEPSAALSVVFRGQPEPVMTALSIAVVGVLSEQLAAELGHRYPTTDPGENRLLAANVLSGYVLLMRRWRAEHDGRADTVALTEWQATQERYFVHLRAGQRAFGGAEPVAGAQRAQAARAS